MNSQPVPVLLMVRELGLGGSERQMSVLARSLHQAGFQPHVGCFRPDGLRRKELDEAGIPVVSFPVRSFKSPSTLRAGRELSRYVRHHGIRLVHSFDPPTCVFAIPTIWLTRSAVPVSSQRSHRELIPSELRPLVRMTDKLASAVVVNSQQLSRHLTEDENVSPSKVRVCYNGLDIASFRTPAMRLRPESLDGATTVIGVCCGLRPEKDLGTLLRAFSQVRRPGLRLVIVGNGPCREPWQQLAVELGIGAEVLFAPETPVVLPWLQAIDIFVLPSTSEALSNALMEGMACGCAAVASRVGGNPELVEHEVTGLLFEPRDVSALAVCLKRLIDDPALRHRLGQAGADLMQRQFSTEAAARNMGAIYDELLAAR